MGLRNNVAETYRGEMYVPFTLAEYRERLKKVKQKMQEEKVDMLYCTAPVSLFYMTGYQCEWYQGEEPMDWLPVGGLAIKADEDRMIYFDRSGHEPLTNAHILGDMIDIRIHSYKIQEETKMSELEFVMKTLKDEGWLKGTIGLEKMSHRPNPIVSKMFDDALEKEGCKVTNASEIIRQIRTIKSPQEIAYHRTASKLCDIGLKACLEAVRPGVTEMEVRAEALYAMTKAGSEYTGIPIPVLSGPSRSAMGHALTSRRTIMEGDMILFDACGVFNRYHTNTVRPISVGEPHPEVAEQIAKGAEAVQVLRKILRPGLTAKELGDTMRDYYKECGLWADRRWCGGYEIGPAFAPSWVGSWVYNVSEENTNERVFVPGNVMNHEVQIYLPREAGMAWYIDTILFEEDRADIMTDIEPGCLIAEW